jgi:spermidine/putrescine transport system permease protein
MKTLQRNLMAWLAAPTGVYMLIFFVLPMLIMLMLSVLTRGSNPADYQLPFTWNNFDKIIFEDITRNVFLRSLRIAFISTLLCFILGYPLAFFISTRKQAWVRQFALFLVILPFWTNFLVRTYAWQVILGRRGVLNEFIFWLQESSLFMDLGIKFIDQPLEILGTETAVLLGLVYSFLPFMVLPIFANVERFNFRLVEAGHDLGANDWWVFWRVVFPNTLPGVVAGWILVFIPCIGAFVTPALLGGTSGYMIGNFINDQFKDSGGSWMLGAASSVVMMVLVMMALYLYLRYADEERFLSEQRSPLDRVFELFGKVIFFPVWLISEGLRWALEKITPIIAPNPRPQTGLQVNHWKIRRDMLIRRVGQFGLWLNPIFCYVFLWIPIIVLVVFSFNDSRRAGGRWQGFTTQWYENIFAGVLGGEESSFATGEMLSSLELSLIVGVLSTIVTVILGVMVSLSLERGKFRGKGALDGLLYVPVVIPDITMGVALLIFFKVIFDVLESLSGTRYFPGLFTVIIAHITFHISFVVIVIRARLTDMNPRYEEAARDLGANEWRTFWRVTGPLLLPGIVAGALLSFTLSLDDFVVTFFVGGGTTTTLTVFVWGLVRRGISPEINAISTIMIVLSTVLILLSMVLQGRNASNA